MIRMQRARYTKTGRGVENQRVVDSYKHTHTICWRILIVWEGFKSSFSYPIRLWDDGVWETLNIISFRLEQLVRPYVRPAILENGICATFVLYNLCTKDNNAVAAVNNVVCLSFELWIPFLTFANLSSLIGRPKLMHRLLSFKGMAGSDGSPAMRGRSTLQNNFPMAVVFSYSLNDIRNSFAIGFWRLPSFCFEEIKNSSHTIPDSSNKIFYVSGHRFQFKVMKKKWLQKKGERLSIACGNGNVDEAQTPFPVWILKVWLT